MVAVNDQRYQKQKLLDRGLDKLQQPTFQKIMLFENLGVWVRIHAQLFEFFSTRRRYIAHARSTTPKTARARAPPCVFVLAGSLEKLVPSRSQFDTAAQ